LPENGIDQTNEESKPDQSDVLSSHLLGGKKKHDEDKNVETEEVQHLDKGSDYLTTMLLQQGIKEVQTKAKKTPPKLDELKKMFVQKLVKSGYVTVGENGRTILTDTGKKYLDTQTRSAAAKVELAKLKNLEYRKSLERKKSRTKRTKTKVLQILKSRTKRRKK
jgi:Trm5-related predicted tRNA methylase